MWKDKRFNYPDTFKKRINILDDIQTNYNQKRKEKSQCALLKVCNQSNNEHMKMNGFSYLGVENKIVSLLPNCPREQRGTSLPCPLSPFLCFLNLLFQFVNSSNIVWDINKAQQIKMKLMTTIFLPRHM